MMERTSRRAPPIWRVGDQICECLEVELGVAQVASYSASPSVSSMMMGDAARSILMEWARATVGFDEFVE